MTERQIPDRDPGVPPDPGPSSDPEVKPRHPSQRDKPPSEASEETLAENAEAPREVENEFEKALTRLPPD